MNKRLIFIAVLTVIALIGIKFHWFELGGKSLYEPESTKKYSTVTHEDGTETHYYSNGKVQSETPYVNNKREGVVKNYYSNGQLKSEETYVNDKLEGINKLYDKEGRLTETYTYKDNELNGRAEAYSKDGKIRAVAEFKHGKQVGTETGYYPNGNPSYSFSIDDNNLYDGKYIEYYENGKMRIETPFIHGKAEGVERIYYDNGSLREINNYADDILDGSQQNFYRNGNLRSNPLIKKVRLTDRLKLIMKTNNLKKAPILPMPNKKASIGNIPLTASRLLKLRIKTGSKTA